jgi:hypothetical protein
MADATEDQLLEALATALAPSSSPAEPSMAELAALQSVVRDVAARSARARATRWRRRVAVVVAGGVVLSGGTAYATSGAAPRPVRSAAFALKLPVESPDLTDAKDALADLDGELRDGRRDKVVKALVDAEAQLAELSPSARASLEPGASALVAAARAFVTDPAVEQRRDGDAPVESDLEDHRSGDGGEDSSESNESNESRGSGSDDSRSGSGSDDSRGSGSSGSDDSSDARDSSGSGSGSDDAKGSGSGTTGSDSGSDDTSDHSSDD